MSLSDTVQNALPTWLGGMPVTANQALQNQAAAVASITSVQTSLGGQQPISKTLAIDDNLTNGSIYTFQFQAQSSTITASGLMQALQSDAPAFITSVQVAGDATGTIWNILFNYEGDGSDVVSDVAASIIAAAMEQSDPLAFIQATQQTTVGASIAPFVATQIAQSTADQTELATAANAAAKASDTSQLTYILLAAAAAIFLFFMFGPKTSFSVGT
jgi:hypothetical protein